MERGEPHARDPAEPEEEGHLGPCGVFGESRGGVEVRLLDHVGGVDPPLEAAVEPQCDHPAEPGAVGIEQVRPGLPVAFGGPPHLFRHGRVVYR